MDSLFDGLAAKSCGDELSASAPKGKGKARAKKRTEPDADADSEDGKNRVEEKGASPKKKSRTMNKGIPPPSDINDAEFAALQARMFEDKAKSKKTGPLPNLTKAGERRLSGARENSTHEADIFWVLIRLYYHDHTVLIPCYASPSHAT